MTEHHYIACDGCSEVRTPAMRELWAFVTIECPVDMVPEVADGSVRPGKGYKYVSGIERHFCPRCRDELVRPLLTLAKPRIGAKRGA